MAFFSSRSCFSFLSFSSLFHSAQAKRRRAITSLGQINAWPWPRRRQKVGAVSTLDRACNTPLSLTFRSVPGASIGTSYPCRCWDGRHSRRHSTRYGPICCSSRTWRHGRVSWEAMTGTMRDHVCTVSAEEERVTRTSRGWGDQGSDIGLALERRGARASPRGEGQRRGPHM